jgi:hypothetical protein
VFFTKLLFESVIPERHIDGGGEFVSSKFMYAHCYDSPILCLYRIYLVTNLNTWVVPNFDQMDIEKLGWLKASEYRKDIRRLTPKEIAGETEYYLSHVSNTLSDLEDKNLAECLTPSRNKGRIYVLTDEGQEMLDEI